MARSHCGKRAEASRALLCPGSAKALSTVTAIIDGMGSCGAALGPLLTGHLAALPGGFNNVFYMLYAASAAAAALLARLVVREVGLQRISIWMCHCSGA